jgi:acyl-CoA thioester hydrolase
LGALRGAEAPLFHGITSIFEFFRSLRAVNGAVVEMKDKSTDPAITYRGVVYPWQCDHMGHMNVMWYTGKFDEATWNLLAFIGITPTYIRERKCGMAAVQQNTAYKKELAAGDLVIVRSKILEVREKVIRFQHDLINDEKKELAATSELTGVHVDLLTRKACPFPQEILERASTSVVAS